MAKERGGEPMTQLIGALCCKSTEVVMLSDRQVERAGLIFERGPKGTEIARMAVALTAGTAHEPTIIDSVRDKYLKSSPMPSMAILVNELIDKFHEVRLTKITNEILRPRGFNSLDDFYNKQRLLHESLTIEINSAIENFELSLHIVLGCVDSKGAHLSYIADPGTERNYDSVGFFCPGTGKEQAESTFVMYNFSPDMSLEETLRIAYLAKERGRMAGGVGPITDGWIINEEGINGIPEDKFRELRKYWTRKKALP